MSTTYDPYWEWLRIAPDRRPPTHYELLGVSSFERDPSKIKAAFQRRYSQVRPYEGGNYNEDVLRIHDELQVALACLTDPAAKQAYDRQLQHHPTIEGEAEALSNTLADVPAQTNADPAPAAPEQDAPRAADPQESSDAAPAEPVVVPAVPRPLVIPRAVPTVSLPRPVFPPAVPYVPVEVVPEAGWTSRLPRLSRRAWSVVGAVVGAAALVALAVGLASVLSGDDPAADATLVKTPGGITTEEEEQADPVGGGPVAPAAIPGESVVWTGTLTQVAAWQSTGRLHLLVESNDPSCPSPSFEAYTTDVAFARELADFTTAGDGARPAATVIVTGVLGPRAGSNKRLAASATVPLMHLHSVERVGAGRNLAPGPLAQPGWQRTEGSFDLPPAERELLTRLRVAGASGTLSGTWKESRGAGFSFMGSVEIVLGPIVRLVDVRIASGQRDAAQRLQPGEAVSFEATVVEPVGQGTDRTLVSIDRFLGLTSATPEAAAPGEGPAAESVAMGAGGRPSRFGPGPGSSARTTPAPEPAVPAPDDPNFSQHQERWNKLKRDLPAAAGRMVRLAAFFQSVRWDFGTETGSVGTLQVRFDRQPGVNESFGVVFDPAANVLLQSLSYGDPIEFVVAVTAGAEGAHVKWLERWQQPGTRVEFNAVPLFRDIVTGARGVGQLAWSPDGTLLASLNENEQVQFWDPATGAAHLAAAPPPANAKEFLLSPDATRLLVTDGGTSTVSDVRTGQVLLTAADARQAVGAAFSPNADRLILIQGSKVHLFRRRDDAYVELTTSQVSKMLGQVSGADRVAWSPDGRWLAVAGYGGGGGPGAVGEAVFLYRFGTKGTLSGQPDRFAVDNSVQFLEWRGNRLFCVTTSHAIVYFENAASPITIELPEAYGRSIAVSPDGSWIALDRADDDLESGKFAFYLLSNPNFPQTLTGEDLSLGRLYRLSPSPDGRRFAIGDSSRSVVVICDAGSRAILTRLPGHNDLGNLFWSPDGKRLAAGSTSGHIRIWDLVPAAPAAAAAGPQADPAAFPLEPDDANAQSASTDPQYAGPDPVQPTNRPVTPKVRLTPGMLVLVQYKAKWYAADVLDVLDDGTVRIHYRGWEGSYDETVSRDRLQRVP